LKNLDKQFNKITNDIYSSSEFGKLFKLRQLLILKKFENKASKKELFYLNEIEKILNVMDHATMILSFNKLEKRVKEVEKFRNRIEK
jgi:hypothetical protein